MKTLTLVFSPFQMLNAIEARQTLQNAGDECHLVYCRGVSDRNAEQIRTMIREEDWASIHYVGEPEQVKTLGRRRLRLEKIWTEMGGADRLILGHFGFSLGRHLVNRFRPREVILLDDGTASHRIHEYRFHESVPAGGGGGVPRWLRPLRRGMQRLLSGVDARAPERLTFFSIYRHPMHPCDQFVPNTYAYWKKQIRGNVQPGEVHFLGGCLVELGIVSEEYYRRSLRAVCRAHPGRRITYFPHRRENPERLATLAAEFGLELKHMDRPYELYLTERQILPGWVATFYSTAVDSCAILLEGHAVTIQAFELKAEEIAGEEQRRFVGMVYDYYRKNGGTNIQILGLN